MADKNKRGIPWPQHEHQMVRFTSLVAYHYYEAIRHPEVRGEWTSPGRFATAAGARRAEDFRALTDRDMAFCCSVVTDLDPIACHDIILDPEVIR